MAESTAKRAKKSNFTEIEISHVIAEVGPRYKLLKESSKVAEICKKKRTAWQEITAVVNAVGGNDRTWESVKKRWKDLVGEAHRHRNHLNGTGGGPPTNFKYYDDILDVIGERKTLDGTVNDDVGDTFHTVKCAAAGSDSFNEGTESQPYSLVADVDEDGFICIQPLTEELSTQNTIALTTASAPPTSPVDQSAREVIAEPARPHLQNMNNSIHRPKTPSKTKPGKTAEWSSATHAAFNN